MGDAAAAWGPGHDPTPLLGRLAADGFEVATPSPTTTVVLDTFDGRLHDAGLRAEHGDGELTLRGTNTVPVRVRLADAPRVAGDVPAGPLRARLADVIEVRALLPVARVSAVVHHAVRRDRRGKVVAAVRVLERIGTDRGAVDGWLAEVTELTGYAGRAADTWQLLRASGLAAAAGPGDAVGLVLDRVGVDPTAHRHEASVPLDPSVPASLGYRRVLANLLATADDNVAGTVDDVDAEFLHDLRVAVRRSRTVLRHGRHVLPADVLAWSEPDLRRLGEITGPARDLDVLAEEWPGYLGALATGGDDRRDDLAPVRAQLDADRAAAHEQLSDELASRQIVTLLDRWRDWLASGDGAPSPRGDDTVIDVVAEQIRKAERRLTTNGRAITADSPAEDVHDVRKDAKRLRYLLECFGGLLPERERKAFVKRLKALQDNLGEHQDTAVHAEMLQALADELPEGTPSATLVGVGRLVELLERRQAEARAEFAERFAEYDSKPTRRALRAMLDEAAS